MGQCYDVKLKLIYKKDEEHIVFKLNEYINERKLKFKDTDGNKNNLSDLIKFFIGDYFVDDDGEYESGFDASYSWEIVLQEMFEAIATELNDGSYIEIYPDSGHYILRVMNGKVV